MIRCQNLQFSFTQQKLIHQLSLEVPSGEFRWISGKSGSGKSSLLKLIAGLLNPQAGEISLDQTSVHQLNEAQKKNFRQTQIGYMHQENHLVEHWNVLQNLSLVDSSLARISSYLDFLRLRPALLSQKISSLSGGEKQRISLIRVLLQNPRFALLDEPTSRLDDETTVLVLRLMKQELQGKTVLIVSHDARLEDFKIDRISFESLNR